VKRARTLVRQEKKAEGRAEKEKREKEAEKEK
jgi:hypothetical protein